MVARGHACRAAAFCMTSQAGPSPPRAEVRSARLESSGSELESSAGHCRASRPRGAEYRYARVRAHTTGVQPPVRLATAGRRPTRPHASYHRGSGMRPTAARHPPRSTWRDLRWHGCWTDGRMSATAIDKRNAVESGSRPRLAQPCVRQRECGGLRGRTGLTHLGAARARSWFTFVAHASHPLCCPLWVPPTETQPCACEGRPGPGDAA